jgi:hypothetical protein
MKGEKKIAALTGATSLPLLPPPPSAQISTSTSFWPGYPPTPYPTPLVTEVSPPEITLDSKTACGATKFYEFSDAPDNSRSPPFLLFVYFVTYRIQCASW